MFFDPKFIPIEKIKMTENANVDTATTPKNWQRDVFALANNEANMSGELPINELKRLAADLTRTEGALNYTVSGRVNERKSMFMSLQVTGELFMVCQRCLEELQVEVDIDNELQLVVTEAELDSEEDELNAIIAGDVSPEKIVGSKTFDILDLLEDEIILNFPQAVVHDVCPTVLPTSAGEKPSPFAVLAKLK